MRTSAYLTHPIFHMNRAESEMTRYMRRLSDRDLALDRAMIPLGSCTMKLNATAEMLPISWPEFSELHPFAPKDQAEGYAEMIADLSQKLADITGYVAISMQPMCGMTVVVVGADRNGNVDVADFRAKAEKHGDNLAACMITYPSTHGVFEEAVREICDITHAHGAQVYLDSANLKPLVGLARPGDIGADVSRINLHKTFCIPHGGSGPGMGPIGVKAHLIPFLPGHVETDGREFPVSAAPYGSAAILPISWSYCLLMGGRGLTQATRIAILNANYIAKRLAGAYEVLYTGTHGRVAHECIIDARPPMKSTGISVEGHRQAADRLRLPPADDELAGGRHPDDRADRVQDQGRDRPLLRRHAGDPRQDPGDRGGPDGPGRQPAQERAPHGRGPDRPLEAALFPRGRLLPGRRLPGRQVLAAGQPGRQRVRRPEPCLRVSAGGELREGGGTSVSHKTPDHRFGSLWWRHRGGSFVRCTKAAGTRLVDRSG